MFGSIKRLLIATVAAAISHSAIANDLSSANEWIGKYPFELIGGRQFYDVRGLRAQIRDLVGSKVYRRLNQIKGPSVPIMSVGHYVAAYQCMKHECGDINRTLVVRIQKGDIAVCWHDVVVGGTVWFLPGKAAEFDREAEGSCPATKDALKRAIARLQL